MSPQPQITGTLPPPLNSLAEADVLVLEQFMTPLRFAAEECIFEVNTPGDSCYLVDRGVVRVDLDRHGQTHSEIDSDTTLGFIEPGGILGELTLLDGQPRSASAYAQTDVSLRRITAADIENLSAAHPRIAAALYAALGRDAAIKLRRTNSRLAQALFDDAPDPDVETTVARAIAAQRQFAAWPEDRVDRLLVDMAQSIADHAEELARANVAETGLGKVESKIIKNRVASLGACEYLVGKPGLGITAVDGERHVTQIAHPVGVVFGLGPVTNPVSTFTFKSLICVKTRNALILSPNRRSAGVSGRVEELLHEVMDRHGAPRDLIQCARTRPNRKKTLQFMAHPGVNLILATGGGSMVKAAYSSGTPAIGVGAGNTPVLVAGDADIPETVGKIMLSKPFDNGMPCGSEHNLVVAATARAAFVEELERQGAAVLSPDEAAGFTSQLVDESSGTFRPEVIGQPAARIAADFGITRPYSIELIVVPSQGTTAENPYTHEKMMPVLSLFTVADEQEGIEACWQLLMIDGCGHTAAIHSRNQDLIRQFGERMPASRILVNSPCLHGLIGLTTGLLFSATLGCGTFGGTSTTDNVTYTHLQNVKRLAEFDPVVAAHWQAALSPVPAS